MSIFDSSSESENEQQITAYNNYYNSNFVEEDVSPGLLSFLYLLCMSLGLFALFEYQYQLYYVMSIIIPIILFYVIIQTIY